jgi:hypothetical protein
MQATARRLSVVSATSCARRRLIRVVLTRESWEQLGPSFADADMEALRQKLNEMILNGRR